ncbi:hypothetical protein ACWGCW_27985 [Streptomyces sp. NPDC054933]
MARYEGLTDAQVEAARAWGEVLALLPGIAQGLDAGDFGGIARRVDSLARAAGRLKQAVDSAAGDSAPDPQMLRAAMLPEEVYRGPVVRALHRPPAKE